MLDGRTVHFHFQFVEPVILSVHTGLACSTPGLREGALCPLRLCEAASPILMAHRLGHIQTSDERIYGLYGSDATDRTSRALAEDALACISAAGMDWLPALSIGGFVLNAPHRHPHTVHLERDMNCRQAAAATVEQAARDLVGLWIEAEATVVPRSAAEVDHALHAASDYMAALMSAEFSVRTGSSVRKQPDGSTFVEEALADYPLTRHLTCYWNASWNRQLFLRGSVFDYVTTLGALYEDWSG